MHRHHPSRKRRIHGFWLRTAPIWSSQKRGSKMREHSFQTWGERFTSSKDDWVLVSFLSIQPVVIIYATLHRDPGMAHSPITRLAVCSPPPINVRARVQLIRPLVHVRKASTHVAHTSATSQCNRVFRKNIWLGLCNLSNTAVYTTERKTKLLQPSPGDDCLQHISSQKVGHLCHILCCIRLPVISSLPPKVHKAANTDGNSNREQFWSRVKSFRSHLVHCSD